MKRIHSSVSSLSASVKEVITAKQNRVFFLLYLLLIVLLFFYSFTQVDLGLTITRVQFFGTIERYFQYIGYFNRPLSAALFITLIFLLYLFYLLLLQYVQKKKVSLVKLVGLLVLIVPVLALQYNAFSYDIFNYIFDARILTLYHQNPYIHTALDFPADPMLGFMHWTHRVYPYGPIWLILSIPLSYLGFQYFIPTLILFKVLAAIAFVATLVAVYKITEKVNPEATLINLAFFAFNPLVLIESLVSAHNDIVMMAFAVWALYFLISKKYGWAFLLLFLSIGVKFATIFLLPLFILVYLMDKRKRSISWEVFFVLCSVFMALAVIGAIVRPDLHELKLSINSQFQPWYLLFVFPIASLLAHRVYIKIPIIIVSLAAILNYVPFLYLGNWDPPVPLILNIVNISAVVIGLVVASIFLQRKHHRLAKHT